MSQATFDDDELFGEMASEMRADIEESLAAARAALPDADAIWDVEAENTLGVLNSLKNALDTGDAEDHLRDAKKSFVLGKRAEAFEDAEDLEEAIAEVDDLLSQIVEAHEQVGKLASTIPGLRGSLQEAGEEEAEEEEEEEE